MPNFFTPTGLSQSSLQGSNASFEYAPGKLISPANTQQIFYGDPVIQLTPGFLRQWQPTDTGPVAGVFYGCSYISAATGARAFSRWFPGASAILPGTDVEAQVITSPSYVYSAMTATTPLSTATQVPLTQADLDKNYNIAYGPGNGTGGNGDVITGLSTAFIDLTSASASTTTLPFRAISLSPGVPGALNGYDPTTPFNIGIFALNFSDSRSFVGTTTAS